MQGGANKIIYKELSYKIIGILFDVFNEIGPGYKEKHYQKAIEVEFRKRGINFISQCPYKIRYKGDIIGSYYMDFLVEGKIVLEIKKGDFLSRKNINQINGYLRATGLKLGILVNFTSDGIKYKRILNIK